MKRNMFGEMNFWCWLIGHKMVIINNHARCERCELPRLFAGEELI
jgi:hypothetical protein